MISGDTIVAISSAVGPAPRMIIRLSGPTAFPIAAAVLQSPLEPRHCVASVRQTWESFTLPALAYCFVGPRSNTGEDVVELHIPGNPLLARQTLARLIEAGARQAEPGEFSARAYFHGKIDLTQAEGIALAVSAANEGELRAARQLLAGELSGRLRPLIDRLADTLALVEVGIDFTEEDVSFISGETLAAQLDGLLDDLRSLVRQAHRFDRLTHEPTIALVGWPNAGKSTLLNALCGQDRAVVSPAAGTTRDLISAEAALPRGLVKLIDTAGIEPPSSAGIEDTPQLEIARQMYQRAMQTIETADRVVLVQSIEDARPAPVLSRAPDLVVYTKADRALGVNPSDPTNGADSASTSTSTSTVKSRGLTPPADVDSSRSIRVSVQASIGLNELKNRLDQLAFGQPTGATLALNQRHQSAIDAAIESLEQARSNPTAAAEITALRLREALDNLGAVTGHITPDDVLGRVFSAFCIGK